MSESSSANTTSEQPFWRVIPLDQMSDEQWESLCDGCGKCCLHKLEDEDTGEIYHTNVACRLLDMGSCRCQDYANRWDFVPDCVQLIPSRILDMRWLPKSCAYRKVALGEDLEWWHPLVSGDPETVHQAGISARGRVISESRAGPLGNYICQWPE